jgi:hypothetical protein
VKKFLAFGTAIFIGVVIGGWAFSRSIPRSFLAVAECSGSCYRTNDLIGLLASAGIQQTAQAIPVVGESTECIAIRHPKPEGRVHLVLFPKRDVRNILELQPEDGPYVLGCFALARTLTEIKGVRNYRLQTNGPALQHATYLHFHVIAK